jgi:hypothetical protein
MAEAMIDALSKDVVVLSSGAMPEFAGCPGYEQKATVLTARLRGWYEPYVALRQTQSVMTKLHWRDAGTVVIDEVIGAVWSRHVTSGNEEFVELTVGSPGTWILSFISGRPEVPCSVVAVNGSIAGSAVGGLQSSSARAARLHPSTAGSGR